MALNAFWGNKKIVLVNVGNNSLVSKVSKKLAEQNFKQITEIVTPNSYAGYYSVYENNPAYTLYITESEDCAVKTTKVRGEVGDRLGHVVDRPIEESRKAQQFYEHHFRMLELDPSFLGSVEIPLKDVKDIPWFYENGSPMLHVECPDEDRVADAIVESIKDYFSDYFNR